MRLLKKREEQRKIKIRCERNKKVAAATAGVVLGAVAGILIAPKSGKETIQDVKEKSNQIKEKSNQIKNKISENLEDTKDKLQKSKLKIKEYLANRKRSSLEMDVVENSEATTLTENETKTEIESVNEQENNTETWLN